MKRNDSKRRWRSGAVLLAAMMLALGALALAGCGGGSSSSAESTTTSSSSEAGGSEGKEGGPAGVEISTEQRACLKEKGLELPEFKGGQGGPPEGFKPPGEGGPGGEGFEKMHKAFEECGIETGGFKGGPGQGGPDVNSAAFKKQITEYVACVRENGYELAEPNLSGEGPVFEQAESESAAFKKASAKCQNLLGGPGGPAPEGSSGESESG